MDYLNFALLFIAGLAGGALNATTGGGWFIVFPMLIFRGVVPVSGNAMTITTLWAGLLSGIRNDGSLAGINRKNKIYLFVISLAGGISGAFLLVNYSHQIFEHIGPYLLLCSLLMFIFYKNIISYFASKQIKDFEYSHKKLVPLFLLNVYGSYFGAGVGMMFIALLRFYGLKDEKQINGLKDFMIAVNNALAVLIFIISGQIQWFFIMALILGSVIGGYYGVKICGKINMIVVKRVMIIIGVLVTLYFLNILNIDRLL